MKHTVFQMPKPVTIKGRTSSITNSFFNSIIPVIPPSEEEISTALATLGMTENTICCAYCGDPHTEWDHFFPLIEGKRPTGYISEIHNLVPCCGKCNQSKGNKYWKDWIQSNAKHSPKTRGIPDLQARIEKLEEYEQVFERKKIRFEEIIEQNKWEQYLLEMEALHAQLTKCQSLSKEIKATVSAKQDRENKRSTAADKQCLSLQGKGKDMREYTFITLLEHPELKQAAASWFHDKWGVPEEAYLECMDAYLTGETELGWYLCLNRGGQGSGRPTPEAPAEAIVGGLGVIENDFHDRKDLSPNVCAMYVEEAHRKQGIAGRLLNMAVEDLRSKGISPVYLVTDHTGFYERYGWEYFCPAQGDGEDHLTRLYIHQ